MKTGIALCDSCSGYQVPKTPAPTCRPGLIPRGTIRFEACHECFKDCNDFGTKVFDKVHNDVKGTLDCPICGQGSPHAHSKEEVEQWATNQVARWGYKVSLGPTAPRAEVEELLAEALQRILYTSEECPVCLATYQHDKGCPISYALKAYEDRPPVPAQEKLALVLSQRDQFRQLIGETLSMLEGDRGLLTKLREAFDARPLGSDECVVLPNADSCGACNRGTNGCAIHHYAMDINPSLEMKKEVDPEVKEIRELLEAYRDELLSKSYIGAKRDVSEMLKVASHCARIEHVLRDLV